MPTTDIGLTLYFRRKNTPPPSVLLMAVTNDNSNREERPKQSQEQKNHQQRHRQQQQQQTRTSPTVELRSRQQKKRQATSYNIGLHVFNSENTDSSSSLSYHWQRHTDKAAQVSQAPDVAYRNTYLDELKREKTCLNNADRRSQLSSSRSPSPRSQQSQPQATRLKTASTSSHNTSESIQRKNYHQQYRTVYDYIRESIKQMEKQRNSKQQNFTTRIKRPQNDDVVLRRVLGEKKHSALSKSSPMPKNDLRNPQSFVNYINHSREQVRVLHTTTPNQPYQYQPRQTSASSNRYYHQRPHVSQHQTDSPEKQQSTMMATATVSNS